jgi:hypothetical protein
MFEKKHENKNMYKLSFEVFYYRISKVGWWWEQKGDRHLWEFLSQTPMQKLSLGIEEKIAKR